MLYDTIVRREAIDKGWSNDRKYRAVAADDTPYLLRISSIDRLARKTLEHEKMGEAARLGIPMCHSIEVGVCAEGAYALHSWVDGQDAETVLASLETAAKNFCAASRKTACCFAEDRSAFGTATITLEI